MMQKKLKMSKELRVKFEWIREVAVNNLLLEDTYKVRK